MTNARVSRANRASSPVPTPQASGLSLDAGDLDRHARMLARLSEAQQLANQAQAMQSRAAELQGAYKVWCEELHERYVIPNGAPGVMPDGTIDRNVPSNPRN